MAKLPALELLKRATTGLVKNWHGIAFLLLAASVFLWVAGDAFGERVVTTSQTADYWEHAASLRALLDDPWQPKNPQLVSPASGPRFVPTFIVAALMARALSYDALGAMGVASCLHLLLFLAGIFCFFRTYFRDPRASLYGLVVMLASWWDAFHYSNVYQLKILFSVVSYPSTAALGISLLGFAFTLRTLRRGARHLDLAGVTACWAVVLITHPLTAALGLAGAMLLTINEPGVAFPLRARVAGAVVLGALLALLWPYFSVKGVIFQGGNKELAEAASELASEAGGRLHPFYREVPLLETLGLALAGLPIALYLLLRRRHWFISLGALAMLLPFAVNAYRPVPLGHRFVLLAVFFLQVAVVWLLLKLTRGAPEAWRPLTSGRRGWISGALVACVLFYPLYWNVTETMSHLAAWRRRLQDGESVNVRYARRVAELAGKDSVILSDLKSSWPLPCFGPKIVALLHPNPLVPDEGERSAAVAYFLRGTGGDGRRLETLKRYGVTHVLTNRRSQRQLGDFLSQHGERQAAPGGHALYRLRPLD